MELLGESPPEHGLVGRLLIIFLHTAGLALYGIVFVELQARLPDMLLAAAIPATFSYLAESLRRFECWVWFAVMFTLCPLPLSLLVALDEGSLGDAALAAWFLAPVMGVIHYLWSRRHQFWADPPTRSSRRPAGRWVTPEWRAARLARIAAGARPST